MRKSDLQRNTLKNSTKKYSKILKNKPKYLKYKPVLAWEREARLNWKSWKYATMHIPSTIHTSCLHVPCMSHVLCQRCSCNYSSGFLMVSLLFSSSFSVGIPIDSVICLITSLHFCVGFLCFFLRFSYGFSMVSLKLS